MSRVALVLVLFGQVAGAADLPPGALARLGDDRFRAGSGVDHFAISPDGKQFATVRSVDDGDSILMVWDAATGRPIREQKISDKLFRGLVWGEAGGFAVFIRAEAAEGKRRATVDPNDIRVWDFTDPKAAVPPVLPWGIGGGVTLLADYPADSPEYATFRFSGDGRRVAAEWRSADAKKHVFHVFELKAAESTAQLKRIGTIDLGAEGADGFQLSADGKTLVTFRTLKPAPPKVQPEESVATVWDVASGKPEKPVRVPRNWPSFLSPDARKLFDGVRTDADWGYDLIDLDTGKQRKLIRWPHTSRGEFALAPPRPVFFPSGRVLVDAGQRQIALIDVETGKELGRLDGHTSPAVLAISADGNRIASADGFGLIRLWDAKSLRPLNDAPGHRSPVEYAQLSPDGKRLLTWAFDDTIRLWDLGTGRELRSFVRGAGANTSADRPTFTPDGTAAIYSTNERLMARDLQTGLEVPLPDGLAKLQSRTAVFAPDGKSVLTWTDDGENGLCEVWDWPSGQKQFTWKAAKADFEPGFSPDGSVIFHHATSPIRCDARTGKELPPAWKDDKIRFAKLLSLRPNPCWMIRDAGGFVPEAREAGTDKPVSQFSHLRFGGMRTWPESLQHIALSPTGRHYTWATGDNPDEIHLVESTTLDIRLTLRGHLWGTRVLGFTPDGSRLLTAGGDHTVLVWDMRLQNVPLPDALKKETDAAKLWESLATGKADVAYLAMARLAREPEAAIKLVKMKLKPIAKPDEATEQTNLADARAIELLEALDLEDARTLLKELASGHADAFRTQEAKRALERNRAVTR